MPKKQPRNAFYFFMIDFKEEQRKKGINYANMAEVAVAAGPVWTSAAPSVRSKFEKMARDEKIKGNMPERKFTSTGISLADLEAAERERQAAIDAERNDIVNFVKQKGLNNTILDEEIFLMDVNSFCKVGASYLIGECTLLRFTLRDGIKDTYHELVNPGGIPIGYAFDVKEGCKELGLEMPEQGSRRSDYIQILANVVDYARRSAPRPARRALLPPFYTMPDKVAPVSDFIHQMCNRAAEDETLFRVYKLDTLFYHLMQQLASSDDESFPKESLALAQLKKDQFKYSPGLACKLHEELDKAIECSMSRVKRWAFTVLDKTCATCDLRALPGRHLPGDFDLDSILSYREERRSRAAPGVAGGGAGAAEGGAWADSTAATLSADSSYLSANDTGSTITHFTAPSVHSVSGTGAGKKRTHVPLRMPQTDYSAEVHTAPELSLSSDVDFPTLGSAGRGRGRSLASSFDRMKM